MKNSMPPGLSKSNAPKFASRRNTRGVLRESMRCDFFFFFKGRGFLVATILLISPEWFFYLHLNP
jgi:hypothetical protein